MSRIHIGTSGWSYQGWSGKFYPEGLDESQWLTFYSRYFDTVEINSTFYRLPFQNMVTSWRKRAPDGFTFAVKGIRRITHVKKLIAVEDDLTQFVARVSGLGEHLGPVLWQLPPQLQMNPDRLDRFLALLPKKVRHAVEFRHRSWLDHATFEILRRHQVALVAVSSLRMPIEHTTTTDFAYLRFHGLEGGYCHDYTRDELAPWMEYIRRCAEGGCDVYAYFNNDGRARAPENTKALMRMLQ